MRSPEWNDAVLFSCMEEGLNGALPARRNVILKQIMALFGTQILIYGWHIFFIAENSAIWEDIARETVQH